VDISLIHYRQRFPTKEEDNLASTTGSIAINLIAMYKALAGGWELRLSKDFIPANTMKEMR
jgi:hypothetical protein